MMMQHKVTMGGELDTDRVLRALGRRERTARINQRNLQAASIKQIERRPKLAHWYCLQVQKDQEFAVERLLIEANVQAFMPREKFVRMVKGKKIESERAFLPGYMLVRCVPTAEAFQGLKRLKHVTDIVGGISGYHVVRDQDVEALKVMGSENVVPRVATDKSFRDGDRALIDVGPFSGFTCLVLAVRWCRQARARVSISLDGRLFEIDSMPLAFMKKL